MTANRPPMTRLRSLLFYAGLSLATVVYVVIAVVILPLPFPLRFRIVSGWSAVNLYLLKVICGLRHEVEGLENIPPGPAIILCKHQSAWETLALQRLFPPQCWVLKRELLKIPIYGWGLATMHPISIDRTSGVRALRQIVRQGQQRLDEGLWVLIFPEGTRTAPGETRRYQAGGGLLAEKSGRPVVPVAHNAGWFWPRSSLDKRPGTIRLVIGPPILPEGKTAAEITREAENWIESTVNTLPKPGSA